MTRPFIPARALAVAPIIATPRPTHVQRVMLSNAEVMLADALQAIRAEQVAEIVATALVAKFGAAAAERIGERIGTLAHLKGRA